VELVSKISNLCGPDPPTLQTDEQTDVRTTCDRKTALCTKVHRAVKSYEKKAKASRFMCISRNLNHRRTVLAYLHIFFLVGSVRCIFSARVRFSRSRSSKVIDFGTNRKRVYNFPLVRPSNLGPILHRFGDIIGFLRPTPISPSFSECSR